ncbi:MAG: DUF1572 domain-containing protein [Flavobacterium sp.]
MSHSTALANRLREVILNGTWIANTNYKAQLEEVPLKKALEKIGDFNSLAALTFHIHYYIKGILDVFEGKPLTIRDRYSFDVPDIHREEDWNALKESLWQDTELLAQEIENFSESNWSLAFCDGKYGSYQRNMDGLVEHAYYHLGQVVILKKQLYNLKL